MNIRKIYKRAVLLFCTLFLITGSIASADKKEWKDDDIVCKGKSTTYKQAKIAWDALKEKDSKFTDEAVAAIIGNWIQENSLCTDNTSGGLGIMQWCDDRKTSCASWLKKNGYETSSLKGQVLYGYKEMSDVNSQGRYFATNCNTTFEDFRELKDIDKATEQFSKAIERPGDPAMDNRQRFAREVFEACTGTAPANYAEEGKKEEKEKSDTVNMSGSVSDGSFYDESHFIGEEPKTSEKDITFADGSDLMYSEQKNLQLMKDSRGGSLLDIIIKTARTSLAFIGIVITVYCIFFYLIYWFDRVNTVTDFSLLKVISFGRVRTSMDDESTYTSDIEGSKEVNHWDVIRIALTGFTLGVFLLSGRIYALAGCLFGFLDSIGSAIF